MTTTETTPMSVAEFLKRLDAEKRDAEAVHHDPAEAARVIRRLASDCQEMKTLLMTGMDLAAEASDPDGKGVSYDFRGRAASFALTARALLRRLS